MSILSWQQRATEKEKDCTVRSIRRVNVRFVADKALRLVNTSHTSTRSENNVDFVLAGKGEAENEGSGGAGGNTGGGTGGGSGEAPDPAA